MADDWLGISSANYEDHCGDYSVDYNLLKALDGDSFWSHQVAEVHWFIIDLGETYTVKKVRARSNYVSDPEDVDIFVSDDKEDWGDAVATGADYSDNDEWIETDTTDKDGRYVKVVINSTENVTNKITFGLYSPSAPIFDVYGDVAAGGVEHTHISSDTMAISDSLSVAATYNVSLDDTLSITDGIGAVATLRAALSDTLQISDALIEAMTYNVALADTMGITDSLAVAAAYTVILADTMNMSDALAAGWAFYVALADTMEISDSLSYELFEGAVKKLRRGHIPGLKPARVVKAGRIGI